MKKPAKKKLKVKQEFPPGWNEKRIRKVIEHYENQTEDEEVAEDKAAFEAPGHTTMVVPCELVPAVAKLIDRHQRKKPPARSAS